MAVPTYSMTTGVLALLNNLGRERQDQANIDEDRSFKAELMLWQDQAEARRQEHMAQLQFSMQQVASLQAERREAEKQAQTYGELSGKLTSDAGKVALGDMVKNLQVKTSTLQQAEDTYMSTISQLSVMAQTEEQRIAAANQSIVGYNRGEQDVTTAAALLKGADSGEKDINKYFVDPTELSKGLSGLKDVNPAYMNESSPERRGLVALLKNMGSEASKYGLEQEKIAAEDRRTNVMFADAQAKLRDPKLQEYERWRKVVEENASKKGITFEQSEADLNKAPSFGETSKRVAAIFDLEKILMSNKDKLDAWTTEATSLYGTDKSSEGKRNGYVMTKALKEGVIEDKDIRRVMPTASNKTKAAIIQAIRITAVKRAADATATVAPTATKRALTKVLNEEAVNTLIENVKRGDEKSMSALRSKFPDIDKIYQEELDKSFANTGTYDKGMALAATKKRLLEK
jgi:hypothetical protein